MCLTLRMLKTNFNFWKFIKHQVPYHVLYMKKSDLFERDDNKKETEFSEKWSEYYSYMGCEDEVNRKGHLTKPKREFMWRMLTCIECGKGWRKVIKQFLT